MSIQYLLDGYNVIHQMKVSSLSNLEDQRMGLIRFIEQCSPQGSPNNSVTVVFDGDTEVFGAMPSKSVNIIFSQGESADEKIKKIVSAAKNTKNIIVVSDDRDIQYAVRALGAKTSSVRLFLEKTKLPGGKNKGIKANQNGSSKSEKYIPKCDEAKITTEMKNIWLKSENGNKK